MSSTQQQWVLWGRLTDRPLFRLCIGTLKQCRGEQSRREVKGAWRDLAIYKKETTPPGN